MKSGRRICGTGAALANAPLVQDKSYFEVKIQCGGLLFVIHVQYYIQLYVVHTVLIYKWFHVLCLGRGLRCLFSL